MDAYFLSKRLRNLTFGFFPVVIFSIAALGHEAFAIELP